MVQKICHCAHSQNSSESISREKWNTHVAGNRENFAWSCDSGVDEVRRMKCIYKSSGNVWSSPSMDGAFYGTAPSPLFSVTTVASSLSLFFISHLFLSFLSFFFFFFRREIFDICLCYKEKLGAWLLAFACSYIRDFLYCFGALHQNHSENGWVSKTKGWRNCSCRRRKGAEILGHSQGKKLFSPSKAPTMMDAILGLVNSRGAVCS